MNNSFPLEDIMAEVGEVQSLSQALALFETMGMPAKNLSPRTRVEYRNDLVNLIAYLTLHHVTQLTQVNLQHLTSYQAEMDRRSYKPSTRRRKTYAIKSFFKFLIYLNLVKENAASHLIPPPPSHNEQRFLTEAEYQRLLRACSHHPRDAAIIETFLQTGIRLSELAKLKVRDVVLPNRISRDFENMGMLHITRKGGKQATIELNYKACQALIAWLKVRPQVDHDALFVGKFSQPLGRRGIQYRVKKYLIEAGIINASTHSIRHTTATHHTMKGTDLRTLQNILGHASLQTTAGYVALARQAQRKALQEHAL